MKLTLTVDPTGESIEFEHEDPSLKIELKDPEVVKIELEDVYRLEPMK